MRIEYLEYLLTVEKTNSLTAASRNLYISQQSLSAAIKNLEKEFDVSILTRSVQGVTFTENGKIILEFARKVVKEYYDVKRQVQSDCECSSGLRGKIIFHYSPAFSLPMMKRFLNDFHRRYPCVSLYCYLNDALPAYVLMDGVHANTFGLFILPYDSESEDIYYEFAPPDGYEFSILGKFRYYAFVSAKSAYASYKSISIKTLLKAPLVTLSTSDYMYDTSLLYSVKRYVDEPMIGYATSSITDFVDIIAQDRGVTLCSDVFCEAEAGKTVFVRLKERLEAAVCVVVPEKKNELVIAFSDELSSYFSRYKMW